MWNKNNLHDTAEFSLLLLLTGLLASHEYCLFSFICADNNNSFLSYILAFWMGFPSSYQITFRSVALLFASQVRLAFPSEAQVTFTVGLESFAVKETWWLFPTTVTTIELLYAFWWTGRNICHLTINIHFHFSFTNLCTKWIRCTECICARVLHTDTLKF